MKTYLMQNLIALDQQLNAILGGMADDFFGHSVSLSGDDSTTLIGSRGSDVVANNGGSAYIFS